MRKQRQFAFDRLESRDLKSDGIVVYPSDLIPPPEKTIVPPGYIQIGSVDPIVMTPLIPPNIGKLFDTIWATGSNLVGAITGSNSDSPPK